SRSRCGWRFGNAANIASLIAREPCDPPNSSNETFCGSRGFGLISKNSLRTGFPVTTPLPGKYGIAASNDTAATSTKRASRRVVNPDTAFDSIKTAGANHYVGRKRLNQAARTEKTLWQNRQTTKPLQQPHVHQSRAFNDRKFKAALRHQSIFQTASRAYESHHRRRIARDDFFGHGNAGIDVTAGAAGRNQHTHRHPYRARATAAARWRGCRFLRGRGSSHSSS